MNRESRLLCIVFAAATARLFAQAPAAPTAKIEPKLPEFRGSTVPATGFSESARLPQLIRAGNLYLSLRDAIALAIENNLDIALQRYAPVTAQSQLLRARAGGAVASFAGTVQPGPTGVGGARTLDIISLGGTEGGISAQLAQGSAGPQPVQTTTQDLTSGLQTLRLGLETSDIGVVTVGGGPSVPALDPIITANGGWNRANVPQTSPFITGTNALRNTSVLGDFGIVKGFLTGTTISLAYDATRTDTNNLRTVLNPNTSSGLGFTLRQRLLDGFGIAVNNRFIRIAKNNIRSAGLTFEQQLFSTVYTVVTLYWDLVSLVEERRVREQTLTVSEQLLRNTTLQEQAGLVAPLEVYRARAEVARARRDLTVTTTRLIQQETILKDYLIAPALGSSSAARARLIPTDTVPQPVTPPVIPISDLVTAGLAHRPELLASRIQLENANISLTGARNALLPTLDLVANASSRALVGAPTRVVPVNGGTIPIITASPEFIGGFGTGLSQIFGADFPNYGVQLQLSIPVFNRGARADYVGAQVAVRQQQIRVQQIRKQVEVDISNALTATQQAAAAYEASLNEVDFQEKALAAEMKRFELGMSTTYLVIQSQRDLSQARLATVIALTDYAKARAGLERATGTLLDAWGISVEDAYEGRAPRP